MKQKHFLAIESLFVCDGTENVPPSSDTTISGLMLIFRLASPGTGITYKLLDTHNIAKAI